jgi:hypothetical protein
VWTAGNVASLSSAAWKLHARLQPATASSLGAPLLFIDWIVGCNIQCLPPSQVLEELRYNVSQAALPTSLSFPSLRCLEVMHISWEASFLSPLGAFVGLERAWLHVRGTAADAAGQQGVPVTAPRFTLPRLPALTRLELQLKPGAAVRVALPRLPALRTLSVLGGCNSRAWLTKEGGGPSTTAATGSGPSTAASGDPPCPLRRLRLRLDLASIDCSAMPALQSAQLALGLCLWAHNFQAASSLRSLTLGDAGEHCFLGRPWVLQVRAGLPPQGGSERVAGPISVPALPGFMSGQSMLAAWPELQPLGCSEVVQSWVVKWARHWLFIDACMITSHGATGCHQLLMHAAYGQCAPLGHWMGVPSMSSSRAANAPPSAGHAVMCAVAPGAAGIP